MGIIDLWAENLFRKYGEQWYLITNAQKCRKKISEFFENCQSVPAHLISAYISRNSLFFPEFENELKKGGVNKKVMYHNKQLTFIVSNNAILIEDNNQLFLKYNSEVLGKRFGERFNRLYAGAIL